jgi:hypothetical protein
MFHYAYSKKDLEQKAVEEWKQELLDEDYAKRWH